MLIHPISNSQNLYSRKLYNQNNSVSPQVYKNSGIDKVSFNGGLKPEVLKNQLKILLTQDIWAEKLKVKMPETPLEKEVLLEVLQNRLKLDRFSRLTNEKLKIKTKIKRAYNITTNNPSHEDLPKLIKEIDNKGNFDSYLNTLNKNIELEIKKNKPAFEYFKNIEKLEDEYLEKRLVKVSWMEKFWHKIDKNNINPEEKLSTKELIDIISNEQAPVVSKAAKNVVKPMSKEQMLIKIEKQYEQFWRENYDVYEGCIHTDAEAQKTLKSVYDTNVVLVEKFPDAKTKIPKIYEAVEQKFRHKINRIGNADTYPIGKIWNDMDGFKTSIKKTMQDISSLKEQLDKTPGNMKIKDALNIKEKSLAELKEDWLEGLKSSIEYEKMNRERLTAAGRASEYDYLTSENRTIKKYKAIFEAYKNNNDSIPENMWAEILG